MAEAQLDEGLGHLQAFAAELGAKHDELDSVGARLGQLQASLDALHGQLDGARARMAQLGDDRHEEMEGAVAGAEAAAGGLLDAGHEVGQTLTDGVATALDQRHDELTTQVDDHGERLTSSAQQLHDEGFAVADQSIEAAGGKTVELREQADAAFEELGAKVDEQSVAVQASAESTTSALAEAGDQQGDVLELVATGFASFDEVTDHLLGSDGLAGAFGGLTADLEGGFGAFGDVTLGLGDQLVEQADALISDTIEVVGQETVQRIGEEFEKVVVGSVEGLITDLADSAGLMSAGSAITAAIGPFVPELAAAKAVVQAIDELLDSLMLG